MVIAIDARELAGHPTGVGRYLGEIVREWAELPEAAAHEFVFCAPGDVATPGGLNARVEVAPGRGVRWEQLTLPRLARRAEASVLFCPGYSGPVFGWTPMVLAVHDVSFAAHPEWFRWREGLRRRLFTRAAAHRAARVLTLTEFSKREIVEHLGVPADRIEVVHPGWRVLAEAELKLGATKTDESEPPRRLSPSVVAPSFSSVPAPLVLYVGSIFQRRHIPETIEGFARLARRRPEARLAIVGDNRTFPRIDVERLAGTGPGVQVEAYVPDEVLRDLYARARAFVFLSEYEGFGLTPLDALAAGIPVVVLDTAVAREAYGPAAIYVAAPDPVLIEAALDEALFNDGTRERLLAEAPAVLARYSWRETARRVLEILKSVDRE